MTEAAWSLCAGGGSSKHSTGCRGEFLGEFRQTFLADPWPVENAVCSLTEETMMSTVKAKKERVEYKKQSRTQCFSISASHKLPVSHNFNITFQCAFPNSPISLFPSPADTCPPENLRHQSGSSQKRAHWHWTSLLQRISFPSDFYDSSKQHTWKTNNRQTFLCNTSSLWKNKNPIHHKSEK